MPISPLLRAVALSCCFAGALTACSVESPAELREKAEQIGDNMTAAGTAVEDAADTTATGIERVIEVAEPIQAGLESAWDSAKEKLVELDTPIPGATPVTPPDPKFFEPHKP